MYVHYGTYGTAALDTQTGRVLWTRRDLKCDHHEGPGSSVMAGAEPAFTQQVPISGASLQSAALGDATFFVAWRGREPVGTICVGGTLVGAALAVLQAQGRATATSATLLTTMLDFSDPGELSVFIDEAYVRQREADFAQGGEADHPLKSQLSRLRSAFGKKGE